MGGLGLNINKMLSPFSLPFVLVAIVTFCRLVLLVPSHIFQLTLVRHYPLSFDIIFFPQPIYSFLPLLIHILYSKPILSCFLLPSATSPVRFSPMLHPYSVRARFISLSPVFLRFLLFLTVFFL